MPSIVGAATTHNGQVAPRASALTAPKAPKPSPMPMSWFDSRRSSAGKLAASAGGGTLAGIDASRVEVFDITPKSAPAVPR